MDFLLQQFLRNSFGIMYYIIMLAQEIAGNFRQPFEQNFSLDWVFFEKLSRVHLGPVKLDYYFHIVGVWLL